MVEPLHQVHLIPQVSRGLNLLQSYDLNGLVRIVNAGYLKQFIQSANSYVDSLRIRNMHDPFLYQQHQLANRIYGFAPVYGPLNHGERTGQDIAQETLDGIEYRGERRGSEDSAHPLQRRDSDIQSQQPTGLGNNLSNQQKLSTSLNLPSRGHVLGMNQSSQQGHEIASIIQGQAGRNVPPVDDNYSNRLPPIIVTSATMQHSRLEDQGHDGVQQDPSGHPMTQASERNDADDSIKSIEPK